MSSVGLCMIVKDEAHVIERCLSSVRDLIDHWVIVDTGSTDGTQDLISDLLATVPGELHERPWVDFGHNRSEALALARPHADYSFVIDADEVFEVPEGFRWPDLIADAYQLTHGSPAMTYRRMSLVANRLDWMYQGVLHEYLDVPGATTAADFIPGPVVRGHFDGGRSQGLSTIDKYARDARTLEAALLVEPDNSRYQYYLARSYRDCGQHAAALEAFRKRATMGGFAEEVADALYESGRMLEHLHADPGLIIDAYLRSWESRPTRAEPLAELARYARESGRHTLARWAAQRAMEIQRPAEDLLWVREDVYAWRCEDEFAVSSYWTGDYAESAQACRSLLANPALPPEQRPRIEENLAFAKSKLAPAGMSPVTTFARTAAAKVPAPRSGQSRQVQRPATTLRQILNPERMTHVLDIGANPIDGATPYSAMLAAGDCRVTGVEPQADALATLLAGAGPQETYLPHVIGNGNDTDLWVTAASGMVSTLEPAPERLGLFDGFSEWGAVRERLRVPTVRLDDIAELGEVDFLRMDVQGGELAVLLGGEQALASTVMVQLEVSFVPLYRNQPGFGELDLELRRRGFLPHTIAALKTWPISSQAGRPSRSAAHQLLEADMVYVRDFGRLQALETEQLRHLALLAHHVCGSVDLAHRVLVHLAERGAVSAADITEFLAQHSA